MTYKILETELMRNGFRHTQLKRDGDIAIYHKIGIKNNLHPFNFDAGFEVVIISRHDGYEISGVKVEPSESYPSAEAWGIKGWTYTNLLSAETKFNSLLGKKVETPEATEVDDTEATPSVTIDDPNKKHRGRTKGNRHQLLITAMEFSCKDLAEANKVDYQIAATFLRESLEAGMLKFVRDERRNPKGKPTKIYSKVS